MLSLVDTSGKVNLLSPWNYDPNNDLIIFLKDGLDVGVGTSIPNTKLHIIGSSPASKLGGGGFFKLGGNNQHIVMDNTKIISKSNGVTESDLQLQEEGHLNVGNHFTTDITNGDNINDTWVIPQQYVAGTNTEVIIMNSYGKTILATSNYQNNWPQNEINFKQVNPVYYYIITTQNKKSRKGSITLVK